MKRLYIIIFCFLFIGCKKDWLDAKPSSILVLPSKVEDYQALLDNSQIMNSVISGYLGEISSGDFQLTYASYLKCYPQDRNAYIWSATDDFYQGQIDIDWRNSYQRVTTSNITLEGIEKLERNSLNNTLWDNVKGSALFYRAYDFFCLAQQYCRPYTETASSDLGIPLRLQSNINTVSKRNSVKETYDQIISDLNHALTLLPQVPLTATRPSKTAVYAMLARVYLSMKDYPNALINANASLNLNNKLLDFSTLSQSSTAPIPRFNDEVIYQTTLAYVTPFFNANFNVTQELLSLYDSNDLRSKIFFRLSGANTLFKGSYNNGLPFFSGLAVDEILLIRSECYARAGKITSSLLDLNNLLKSRYVKTTSYVDFITSDKETAISKILLERRKELCFRGIRWTDLRRLNQEETHRITLKRTLNGIEYTLLPNDVKYVFPIDANEIRISGIQQNPRN